MELLRYYTRADDSGLTTLVFIIRHIASAVGRVGGSLRGFIGNARLTATTVILQHALAMV